MASRRVGGPKKVPMPLLRAPSSAFVLGSRPQTLRAQAPQRIKPGAANTTQYGKADINAPPVPQGFGDTGMSGLS